MELEPEAGYTTDTCGGRPFLTGVRETPGGSNRKARLQTGFSLTLRHTCWQRHRRCCAEPTVGPPRAELLRKNRMDRKGRCWVEYRYTSGARPLLTAVRATPGVSNRKARLHPGFSHLLTLSDVMSILLYQLPHLPDHVEGSSGDARDKRE